MIHTLTKTVLRQVHCDPVFLASGELGFSLATCIESRIPVSLPLLCAAVWWLFGTILFRSDAMPTGRDLEIMRLCINRYHEFFSSYGKYFCIDGVVDYDRECRIQDTGHVL